MNKTKIAVVLPCNIYTAPFLSRYEKILTSNHENFDLIYWNRALIDEESEGNMIPFNSKDKVNSGNWVKIINYVKFGIFVKRILKKNNYEKIIVLGSYAGIMYQIKDFLIDKYKNRYWLDIRDYTFENVKFYYEGMQKVISESYSTTISSRGYENFLPNHDYVIAHNIDYKNIDNAKELRSTSKSCDKIRISFIGLVRYYDENIKLLKALGNDDRFIISYFGMNSEFLKDYCAENDITNVKFHGRFDPSKTGYFYRETDIINNVYGNDSVALTTALSNKMYFSVFLNIPILVSPNTYMEEIAAKNGYGYSVDWNNVNLGDDLYNWYQNYINNKTANNQKMINIIKEEDDKFVSKFMGFLNN